MKIPLSVLNKFILLWKDETGEKLPLREAKLKFDEILLVCDQRKHNSLSDDQ